jgi:phosphopantetheinyl transferase
LQIWVIKEAVLKASGSGLAVSPRRVTVSGLPSAGPPALAPAFLDGRPARVWAWRDARLALAIAWLGDSPEELAPSISVDY